MSRYENAHADPEGPGDARPTAIQIVKDEGVEGKLQGKVIVVTGTSSGIGIETARALALTGARLFLTARNLDKATAALDGILVKGHIELVEMDNTSFESVRKAAAEILSKSNNQVNILINNAGIMAIPNLGSRKMAQSCNSGSTPQLKSRVVSLTSSAHHAQGINESDNYNFQNEGYSAIAAYGQSKTANLYMANTIERRYGSQGLHATAVHPGAVITALAQHLDDATKAAMSSDPNLFKIMKNPEQGAATSVWAAIGAEWENKGGVYLADVHEEAAGKDDHDVLGAGYASWAFDPVKENRLWEDSSKIVDVPI